jgi:predicted unusual protein kinase regulating ubiquinone biosynthesis (AarF/ABC1/UbiB family)
MAYFIKTAWNFIIEITRLYKINKYVKIILNDSENVDEIILNNLHKLIIEGGSIYIKFAQWFISHASYNKEFEKVVNYFNHLFENCPSQTIEQSDIIYFHATKKHLIEDIKIETIREIGSGSIGTVYYAETLLGKKIALKIKHPHINSELNKKKGIINIIRHLQKVNLIRRYFNLCFDLNDFITNMNYQINFNIEADNLKRMKENLKDNKCIIIPEVLYHNENVLITEYIETINMDDIGEYEKNLVAINLVCLLYQMCLVDNFIHGDLHCKNWKIKRSKENNLQIVLFDLGICFSVDNISLAYNFWNALENGDSNGILDVIKELCTTQIPLNITNQMKELIQNISNNRLEPTEILKWLLKYFTNNNLKVHPYAANMLIMLCLVEKFLKENGFIQQENKYSNICSILRNSKIDILSFCECYKSYPDVANIIKQKIKEFDKIVNKNNQICNLLLKSPDEIFEN